MMSRCQGPGARTLILREEVAKMAEWVKILVLGVCLFAFVAASCRVIVGQKKRMREQILKAYGFERDEDWWKKPGYSI